MCYEYRRELEADYVAQREKYEELERQHQRNLWMLIITAGGRVVVPRHVQRDAADPGIITASEDPRTGDIIFTADLHTDGVSKPSM